MQEALKLDALIIGGGVAGLWLLNRLRNEGYQALLLEQEALGTGQSIASQGMIHGGIKYALGGKLTGASKAIADMPAHWQQCLEGKGDVDLQGCQLLSDSYYMWPRSSLRSRLNAFLGSKALEAKVDSVEKSDYPDFFANNIPGPLYRLRDIVLDVPSLLETLYKNHEGHIFRIDWQHAALEKNPDGSISCLNLAGKRDIQASKYIFCCGAGAESIISEKEFNFTAMQRRPLQMVMVRHDITAPVYVHCVSDKLTMTPEVTITTHRNGADQPVWYLGGEIAEQGVQQSPGQLIDAARTKLQEIFPWCDFSGAEWATLPVDRAELRQEDGSRPDDPGISARHNILMCWPTKLTLAPNLANTVLDILQAEKLTPTEPIMQLDFLDKPGIASTPWENL